MAKGGMRLGAGRPAYKVKGEHLQRVDVRVWARRKWLDHQGSFSWSWSRGGEPMGSISVLVQSRSAVTLQYTISSNGEARHFNERVSVIYKPCNFGGSRPWLQCPRCARHVALLYLRGGRFACRHCQRVAYSSQAEDAIGRTWRKQAKIEARLGDNWERPKGMRIRIYNLLINSLIGCEQRRDEAFGIVAMRLFGNTLKDRLPV